MPKRLLLILAGSIAFLCVSCSKDDSPRVREKGDIVVLQNNWVSFEFNSSTGSYSLSDRESLEPIVSQAVLRINDWSSGIKGQTRTWEERIIENEFGEGLALDLKISGQNQPDLLFSVILYQDKSFVDISGGIYNSLDTPVQVKDMYVLEDGTVYKG